MGRPWLSPGMGWLRATDFLPRERGLEVRRGYGMRVVAGWGSEASWCPGIWDGERDRTTWV